MSNPTVISTVPSNGEVDVAINVRIIFAFSKDIDSSSVNKATFVLYKTDSLDPVEGSIDVSGNEIKFLPNRALLENLSYTVAAVGSGDSAPGGFIKSTDGDALLTTKSITFRTGEERFVSLEEITSRDDIESIGPIRAVQNVLPPVTTITAASGYMDLVDTSPDDRATNVSLTTDKIVMTFDENLDTLQDPSGILTVEQFPVLGMDEYLGQMDPSTSDIFLQGQSSAPTGLLFEYPAGSISISGKELIFDIDDADDFLYNTEVMVTIDKSVKGASGKTLENDETFLFTTEYFPLFVSSRLIRIEIGPIISNLYDDTLNRIIHKNSIEAWELSGRAFSLDDPPWYAKQYAKCKSIVDIMMVVQLQSEVGSGSKKLGDFEITRDKAQAGLKLEEARTCLRKAEDTLRRKKVRPTFGVKGIRSLSELPDFRIRTWDEFESDMTPAQNLRDERRSKLPDGRLDSWS